jgi:hypothetical protein
MISSGLFVMWEGSYLQQAIQVASIPNVCQANRSNESIYREDRKYTRVYFFLPLTHLIGSEFD